MDSQGNPLDRDVWGSSPSDAWRQIEGMDVHGNSPHDVYGNYAGDAFGDALGAIGNDPGGIVDGAIALLDSLFGS